MEPGTNLGTAGDHPFHLAYGQNSGDAPKTYRMGSTDATVYFRTWNGTSWSAAATGPDITNPPSAFQLQPASCRQENFLGIARRNDGALSFMRWTGSTFVDSQVRSTDLGGSTGNECLMFAGMDAGTHRPRIARWQAVAPQ